MMKDKNKYLIFVIRLFLVLLIEFFLNYPFSISNSLSQKFQYLCLSRALFKCFCFARFINLTKGQNKYSIVLASSYCGNLAYFNYFCAKFLWALRSAYPYILKMIS